MRKWSSSVRTYIYCRFRFRLANACAAQLRNYRVSGERGEGVFPVFVANPRTVRLFSSDDWGQSSAPSDSRSETGFRTRQRLNEPSSISTAISLSLAQLPVVVPAEVLRVEQPLKDRTQPPKRTAGG